MTVHITINGTPLCTHDIPHKAYMEAPRGMPISCSYINTQEAEKTCEYLKTHDLEAVVVEGGCPDYGNFDI